MPVGGNGADLRPQLGNLSGVVAAAVGWPARACTRARLMTSAALDVLGAEPRVTAAIVAFNSGPWLEQAVASALSSTVPVAVVVSDNGSEDDSISRVERRWGGDPRVRVFRNGRNLGFAAASNRALAGAVTPWLLLLNPDCRVRADALEQMILALEKHPDAGMGGGLLRNEDGSEQAGCRRREPTLRRSLAWLLRRPLGWFGVRPEGFNLAGLPLPKGAQEVEAISGAFTLVRRDAAERVGMLDEGYFLHCEDLDWCRRFRDAGYRILFVPEAVATHVGGTSSRGRPVRTEWHKHRGMIRYYGKFAQGPWRRARSLAMAGLIAGRFMLLVPLLWWRRVFDSRRRR